LAVLLIAFDQSLLLSAAPPFNLSFHCDGVGGAIEILRLNKANRQARRRVSGISAGFMLGNALPEVIARRTADIV